MPTLFRDAKKNAPDAGQGIEGNEGTNPLGKEPAPMSVDNLGGRTTFYFRSVLGDNQDRIQCALLEAVDIEGVQPLHASLHGDRTFRSIAELDTLIAALQELRTEWTHLTTPMPEARSTKSSVPEDSAKSVYSGYRLEVVRDEAGIDIFIDDTVTPSQSVDQAHEFLYAIAASATAAAEAVKAIR